VHAHALTVRVHAVSDSAKNKIESKGGSVEMLPTRASAS
jgi:ribosomal protein L15